MAAPASGTTVNNTATVTRKQQQLSAAGAAEHRPQQQQHGPDRGPAAPITITKVTDNSPPAPDQTFHYTVKVTNIGTSEGAWRARGLHRISEGQAARGNEAAVDYGRVADRQQDGSTMGPRGVTQTTPFPVPGLPGTGSGGPCVPDLSAGGGASR